MRPSPQDMTSALPDAAHPEPVPSPAVRPEPRWLVVLLLTAALLPRLAVFPLNENYFGDAVIRTELAQRWAEAPHWIASFDDGAYQFGPLHLYLVGLALKLWSNREHAGRLVSLLFGVLSVLPLYGLTRRLFGWRAAAAACLGLSVWGLHLQLSTTAASEALGLFLVLATLSSFAGALEARTLGPLFVAGFWMNLACATRYDVWLLMPLLVALLAWPAFRKGEGESGGRVAPLTRAVLFGAFCLPFPLAWMQGNELARGDPFWPATYIASFHKAWFPEGVQTWGQWEYRLQNLFFWPGTAVVTLTPLVALAGFVGLGWAWSARPQARWLVWVIAVPTAYFTMKAAVLGNFVPLARFAVVQVALVLVFVGPGFEWVLRQLPRAVGRGLVGLAGLCAVGWPLWLGAFTFRAEGKWQDMLRPISPTSTNPLAMMAVADYVKREATAHGEALLLDADPRYLDMQVAFFSGLPEERLVRFRWNTFQERVREVAPRFVVRMDGGRLLEDPAFELDVERGKLRFGDWTFDEVPGFAAPFHVYRR